MAEGIQHAEVYGAAGILVAILIIAGIVTSGFQIPSLRLPSFVSDRGTLIIKVMDKPITLKHLNLTIDWVKIKDPSDQWILLDIKGDAPFYFDLLALQNVSETLSETQIPAGNYSMMRMHILTANATYPDGETVQLRVPSDVIRVILKPHIKMESGSSITVLIDLQPEDLETIAISHSLNLRPVIKAVVESG
jgi:hypothetical protein